MRLLLPGLLACLSLLSPLRGQAGPPPVREAADWQGLPVVPGELLVQFRPGTPAGTPAARAAELGAATLGQPAPGLLRAALPAGASLEEQRLRWAALPEVEFAQPNVLHRPVGPPDDPKWSLQWGLPKVRADVAWEVFTGDPAVVVALIDSGADSDHPDLAAHYAWGLDTWAGDDDPEDASGHGSHCAGIAAGVTGNGLGIAGVAPDARFAAYRCGDTTFPTSALVAAIHDAVERGAHVLSMSWGSAWADPAIKAALLTARDAGCLLVAAAGNDGVSTPFYPAAHDFVVAVGASTATDSRASFSNWGAWVDLTAPGQAIYSTHKAGGYKYLSGTSMACPLVAGAGALLYARLGQRTPAHAALVRAALEQSAVDVGDWVAHGRLDLAAALERIDGSQPPQIDASDPAQLPALGGNVLLSGSGLGSATSVTLDGQALDFAPGAGGTLACNAPATGPLGPCTLVVTTPGGSDSVVLHRVATSPPGLSVPASTPAGASCSWTLGGLPGEHAWLLLALQPDTFQHAGHVLLLPLAALPAGPLDAAGLGVLQVDLPLSAAGLSFRSQLATVAGGLSGASAIATTVIQ